MQPLSFLASPGGQSLRLPMREVDELLPAAEAPLPVVPEPVAPLVIPEPADPVDPVAPLVVPDDVVPLVPGR